MSENCLFCRIAAGTVPSVKVHEEADVVAFMDIGPIVKGHALVIPRAHYEALTDVPDGILARVFAVARRVAAAQRDGLKADGFNLHQSNGACAGQVVPHVHVHVIPRFKGDGHRWNWASRKYDDPAEMAQLAERMRAAWPRT